MKARSKALLLALCAVLLVAVSVLGTMAYLTSKTQVITNTFTVGDINIELTETKPESRQAKIIPGVDIEKDPKVTVKANSEACWLFVKVEQTGTFVTDKVTYSVMTGTDGWKALPGVDGVYYREVGAVTTDTDFYVLTGNTAHPNGVVIVSDKLTKAEIDTITDGNQPKLTFTAYAVQKEGIDTAADAWAKVNTTSGSN
ncbi:Uncharacterised protein [uncultured Clostridium sp.]|nr:Uncharacterised protein [uncultured Clostridium sp.]